MSLLDFENQSLSFKISLSAIIGAIYAVLTVVLMPIGYSWIQIRVSEMLTPLPFILGAPAVIGLTIGCFIANIMSPIGLPDLVFGPLLTLLAAILSWKISFNRKTLACIYPVIVNAVGVSVYVSIFYGVPYLASVIAIGIGETISAGCLGYLLLRTLENANSTFSSRTRNSQRPQQTE